MMNEIALAAVLGFSAGVALCSATASILMKREWSARHRIESRVNKLYLHLSCGQGYLGCKGGPRCTSDHK